MGRQERNTAVLDRNPSPSGDRQGRTKIATSPELIAAVESAFLGVEPTLGKPKIPPKAKRLAQQKARQAKIKQQKEAKPTSWSADEIVSRHNTITGHIRLVPIEITQEVPTLFQRVSPIAPEQPPSEQTSNPTPDDFNNAQKDAPRRRRRGLAKAAASVATAAVAIAAVNGLIGNGQTAEATTTVPHSPAIESVLLDNGSTQTDQHDTPDNITQITTRNYAGYLEKGTFNKDRNKIKGEIIISKEHCHGRGKKRTASWFGLTDGEQILQAGVLYECDGNTPSYELFDQFFPHEKLSKILPQGVSQGDTVFVKIIRDKKNKKKYRFSLHVIHDGLTLGTFDTKTIPRNDSFNVKAGEGIVEDTRNKQNTRFLPPVPIDPQLTRFLVFGEHGPTWFARRDRLTQYTLKIAGNTVYSVTRVNGNGMYRTIHS